MKYEPKEPVKEKVWVQCPDYEPFTWKEKVRLLFWDAPIYAFNKTPLSVFVYPLFLLTANFPNCKKFERCKNAVPTYKFGITTHYYECKAGEYKTQ